jgi:DNA-binding NarL/FixJ family response regulator
MQYPQLIVYETDLRLATWLREAVDLAAMLRYDERGQPVEKLKEKTRSESRKGARDAEQGWIIREPRQSAACLRLMQQGGPAVLVIQLNKDAVTELALLEQTAWRYPDVMIVVVGEETHQSVAPLAWGLGATAVLLPPRVGERLQETVLGLMRSAMVEAHSDGSPSLGEQS